MLEYDFHNCVTYWVNRTADLLKQEMNAQLSQRGITLRQVQVLGSIALEGSLSQVELAERLGIEPPSLVPVLDRMEKDGLIERVLCTEDRRRRLISPLPKAQQHWDEIVAIAREVRAAVTVDLSSKQLAELNASLESIRERCQSMANERKGVST